MEYYFIDNIVKIAFTDPKNTPKWIDAIVTEETNEWPPKLGTVYKNLNKTDQWRELKITEFEEGKTFVLSDDNGFHIRYTFTPLSEDATELEFYIWIDNGELKNLFTSEPKKLKQVIEKH